MNILFVGHNDFLSNSTGHIAGFANVLSAQGYSCIAAVPFGKETAGELTGSLFIPAGYEDVLSGRVGFPDGRPADIVHAWTPRENVRRFVARYRPTGALRLAIHLEDNEELLIERWTNMPFDELAALSDETLAPLLTPALCHPRRYRSFLRTADAATVITGALAEFVPEGVPSTLLRQGLDLAAFQPGPRDLTLAPPSALAPADRVLAYTGNLHHANGGDVRALLLALQILNSRGYPCKLVRTGAPAPDLIAALAPGAAPFVIDLGFLPRETIPAVLRMADILVQPGEIDRFNIYRLPSKIPEFLGVGRPVILPACNIADEMAEGEDALFLRTGSPEEIAGLCIRLFEDEALADRLGRAGAAFARRFFDPAANAATLDALYRDLIGRPVRTIRRDTALASLAGVLVQAPETFPPGDGLRAEIARELRLSRIEKSVEDAPDGPICRCYEPVAGGHREDRSTARMLVADRWQRVRFDSDSADLQGQIRIDPAESPCLFEVAGVTIRSPMDDGAVLWRARGADLARLQLAGTARRLNGGRTLRGFSFGADPQILLPSFAELSLGGPLRVELWLRVSLDLTVVAERLTQLAAGAERLAAAAEQLAAAQERLAEATGRATHWEDVATGANGQLAAERLRVERLESSLSWRVTAPLRTVSRIVRSRR